MNEAHASNSWKRSISPEAIRSAGPPDHGVGF